jgi:hypothetical protein
VPILKNDGLRQWEGLSPIAPIYYGKEKKCSKPPTRYLGDLYVTSSEDQDP